MKLETKETLIALRSIIELQTNFSSLKLILSKLDEPYLADQVLNELKRSNYGNALTIIDKSLHKISHSYFYEINDIKKFEFHHKENITIEEIKILLEVNSFDFHKKTDKVGKDVIIMCHWDNQHRFAVYITDKLLEKIEQYPKKKLEISKINDRQDKLGYFTVFNIEEFAAESNRGNYSHEEYDSSNWLADAAGTSDPEVMNDTYWNLD